MSLVTMWRLFAHAGGVDDDEGLVVFSKRTSMLSRVVPGTSLTMTRSPWPS